MIPPRYQDIAPERIPEVNVEGGLLRVVAGEAQGHTGPVQGIDVAPLFVDYTLQPGARVVQPVPPGHTAFVFVTDGTVRLGASRREVPKGNLAVLTGGDVAALEGEGAGGRALLIAGRPLGEPVSRWGPFVMNTDAEIQQAISDYRSGKLAPPLRGG
jgi:hypothetical protein